MFHPTVLTLPTFPCHQMQRLLLYLYPAVLNNGFPSILDHESRPAGSLYLHFLRNVLLLTTIIKGDHLRVIRKYFGRSGSRDRRSSRQLWPDARNRQPAHIAVSLTTSPQSLNCCREASACVAERCYLTWFQLEELCDSMYNFFEGRSPASRCLRDSRGGTFRPNTDFIQFFFHDHSEFSFGSFSVAQ
jgi:hypothetical protein